MSYQFLPATAADVDRLLELRRERCEAERTPFDLRTSRTALNELLFQPNWGRVWTIAHDGSVVGYVLMTIGFNMALGGRYGFFDEMYVQLAHRGQDLGGRCLSLVEATCMAMDLRYLAVGIAQLHGRAQTVWRQAGFGDGPFQMMVKPVG